MQEITATDGIDNESVYVSAWNVAGTNVSLHLTEEEALDLIDDLSNALDWVRSNKRNKN